MERDAKLSSEAAGTRDGAESMHRRTSSHVANETANGTQVERRDFAHRRSVLSFELSKLIRAWYRRTEERKETGRVEPKPKHHGETNGRLRGPGYFATPSG